MESGNERQLSRRDVIRLATLASFLLILIGGFEPFYLRIFTIDRARESAVFEETPYRKMTGLRAFLQGVDAHTPPHARIALWVPFLQWDGGYGYAYSRSSYLLPGKQMVPLLGQQSLQHSNHPDTQHNDPLQFANLRQAEYLASYGALLQAPGFVPVWRDEHGVLLRAARGTAHSLPSR